MTEEAVAVGLEHVVAPDEDDLGIMVVRSIVARLLELRGVEDGQVAVDAERQRGAWHHAAVAREEAERHVGGSESRVADERVLPADVAAGADHAADRLRAPLLLDAAGVLDDDVVGLVPRDALPLVLAALADPLERVLEAIFGIERLDEVEAADAQPALVVRDAGVALDVVELTVFHIREEAAAVMAAGCGPMASAIDVELAFLPMKILAVEIRIDILQIHSTDLLSPSLSSHASHFTHGMRTPALRAGVFGFVWRI